MKHILLLATTTGYQIRSFGEAADRANVRIIFASDRCDQLEDPWWDGAIPVRFHDTAASVDTVLASCQGRMPSGVLAVGDRPTLLAAHVAAALGLPGNPPAGADASRNKLSSRQAFAAAGLPTPMFDALSLAHDPTGLPRVQYPAVVKPLFLSGSCGVIRVDDQQGFEQAFVRIRRLLREPDVAVERNAFDRFVLVEQFIPGREYAVEGVLTKGRLQVFAVFDKPDPLDGPYFEETIYVTPSRAPAGTQAAIVDAVARAAQALGLWHGPLHAECRVNEQGVFVLEVAARPIGGLCSKAVRLVDPGGREATLEDALLRHAIGEPIDQFRQAGQGSGVMMIPIPRRGVYKGVTGSDAARRVDGVDDVRITAKLDETLVPLPEGRSYLGFIFARGADPAQAEAALRESHARLGFLIERELSIAE